jgi:nitrogen fixation-related uncharacterized protein
MENRVFFGIIAAILVISVALYVLLWANLGKSRLDYQNEKRYFGI